MLTRSDDKQNRQTSMNGKFSYNKLVLVIEDFGPGSSVGIGTELRAGRSGD